MLAGPASPDAEAAGPFRVPPPVGARRAARARARWAVLRSRGRVVAGPGAAIGRGVTFGVMPGARVRLGAGTTIGDHSRIQVRSGELLVGDHAALGDRCVVDLLAGAVIKERAQLGDGVVLLDHAPEPGDVERPVRKQEVVARPISIGGQACIGPRAFIGPGVKIGARAQIGTLAVIEDDVPAGARVEGRTVLGRLSATRSHDDPARDAGQGSTEPSPADD